MHCLDEDARSVHGVLDTLSMLIENVKNVNVQLTTNSGIWRVRVRTSIETRGRLFTMNSE